MATPLVPGPRTAREKRALLLFLLLWPILALNCRAQEPTVTTLAVSAATVPAGTVVTLTATVRLYAGGPTVSPGLVNFCVYTLEQCTDIHLLGSVQLSAAGTATMKLVPGIGVHRYRAIFAGTAVYATSTSPLSIVTVTGLHPSTTTMATAGGPGNYTLSATVTGMGSLTAPQNGVSFNDLTADYVLGALPLGAPTLGLGFLNPANPATGSNPTSVVVADFNGDGLPDIATANYGNGEPTNNPVIGTVSVFLSNGDGTFISEPPVNVEFGAQAIATGDFNGDGKPDLAVANLISNTVSILLGNGDGTFTAAADLSAYYNPYAVAVGDFNGDGIADVAVLKADDLVNIFLGNGDGTFNQVEEGATTGDYPRGIAVGDFNGDGVQDLAVTNTGDNNVTILLGNGDGTLAAADVSPATGNYPYYVAVADFNGDGNQDLAVANANGNSVTILLGNGDGTFTAAPVSPATGNNPYSLLVADFNGDNIADIAVPNLNSTFATLLLGNGDGSFTASTNVPTGQTVFSMAAGDFNKDGIPDLAAALYYNIALLTGNDVAVLLTQLTTTQTTANLTNVSPPGTGVDQVQARYAGDANFATSTSAPVGLTDERVITTLYINPGAEPVNGFNGLFTFAAILNPFMADIYSTDGEAVTFYNGATNLGTEYLVGGEAVIQVPLGVGTNNISAVYPGDADFAPSTSPVVPYEAVPANPPVSEATATALTLSSASVAPGTVVTLTATVVAGPTEVNPGKVNFCDATAPRCTDIHLLGTAQLTANGTAVLSFVPGIGTHSYTAVFTGTASNAASTSAPQALTVTGGIPTQTTLTSAGTRGSYTLTGTIVETGGPTASPGGTVSFLDASNNNALLGTAAPGASTTTFNFLQTFVGGTGVNPQTVMTGDFNGDGLADLVFANGNDNTLTVLLGAGNGTFIAAPTITTGADPFCVAVGDFDANGFQDMAVTNVNDDTISILLGKGDGTFSILDPIDAGGRPVGVAVGDFNGDGIQDLVVATSNTDALLILLGNGDGTFNRGQADLGTDGAGAYFVAVADFNGDGIQDLAVTNLFANTLTIMLGNGDGTFTPTATSPATGLEPFYLTTGDFNGDGIPDLAVTNFSSGDLTILLGNGDGTFTTSSSPATGNSPSSIALADYNGDGIEDLAVTNAASNTITLLIGNGDGTFTTTPNTIAAPGLASSLAAADFNGDGVPDLAISASNTNNMTALLTERIQSSTAAIQNIPIPGAGTHNIGASYAGNGVFSPSTSATIPLLAGSLALIQSSINGQSPIPYGPLPVTVTVTGIGQTTPLPTGSVYYFLDNLVAVPVPGTLTNGSITFTLPQLGAGAHFINFSYSGDDYYAGTPNNTPPPTLAVPFYVAPGTLTVTANSVASPYGQPLPVFTDTITGFLYNDTLASAVTGAAALTTTATPTSAPGTYPITAAPGTLAAANYNFAYAPGTLTINPSPGTLAVTVTPSPVRTPNPLSLVATLTSASTGATGMVSFMDGATILGQTALTPAGTAVLNGITLGVGVHTLSAAYSGNADFLPETAPAVSLTVEALAVQLTSIAPTLATMGDPDTPITATGANFAASSVINFNGTPLATTFVSPTQLQAVIPAALLAATGNVNVTVTDAPSVSISDPAAFSIVPPVQVTFSGPPSTSPGDQPPLTFQLQQAFPTELDGVMTLTFTPNPGSPDNPEVQFASGGRTFNFTLPANTTTTPAIMLQAGTVAGNISVSLQLTSAGVNVTPTYIAPIAIVVPQVAPTVSSVSFSASGTTLTVLVSGFSSTREIQQATFNFTPIDGVTLAATSVTVPATPLFETWYSDTDSAQYGSSFTYTQTFTLSAMASQIAGVGVTLTNSVGTSTEVNSQ